MQKVRLLGFFNIPHTRRWFVNFALPLQNTCEKVVFK